MKGPVKGSQNIANFRPRWPEDRVYPPAPGLSSGPWSENKVFGRRGRLPARGAENRPTLSSGPGSQDWAYRRLRGPRIDPILRREPRRPLPPSSGCTVARSLREFSQLGVLPDRELGMFAVAVLATRVCHVQSCSHDECGVRQMGSKTLCHRRLEVV